MQDALKVLGKAKRAEAEPDQGARELGVAADAIGHMEEAQEFHGRALKAAPDSVALCRMASSKYAQGKYDDAMGLLRQIIQKKPRRTARTSRWRGDGRRGHLPRRDPDVAQGHRTRAGFARRR